MHGIIKNKTYEYLSDFGKTEIQNFNVMPKS